MTRRITPGVAYGLLAVGAAAVSMLVSWTALAAQFDNNVYDFIFRVRPTERADAGAVLLAFDERTLHRYGGIAGMRPALTQALDQMAKAPPRVVAIDLTLTDPGGEADAALEAAFRRTPGLVLGCEMEPDAGGCSGWQDPVDLFRTNAALGHVHALAGPQDEINRRITLERVCGHTRRWALSLEALRLYKQAKFIESSPTDVSVGSTTIASRWDDGRPLWVRYRNAASVARVSMDDVIAGRDLERLRGKVVFVGVTAQSAVRDRLFTPLSGGLPMPGVEIHLQAFETMATGDLLYELGPFVPMLLALVTVALAAVIFTFLRGWVAIVCAAVLLLLAHLVPYAFFTRGLILDAFAPVAASWLGVLSCAGFQYFYVRRRLVVSEATTARYQQAFHFVAHEMRTPLTAIQGSSELMTRYNLPELKRKELGQMINSESKRLAKMITTFLDVEKLEAGQLELRRATFPLQELVDTCYQRAMPLAERKQIRITSEVPDDLIVNADRELLEYAVYNLMTNAVKYSAPETDVLITAAPNSSGVSISVRDHGMGMDAGEVKNLFRKFYRTRRAEQSGEVGTGIGLSVVQQIVVLHGGHVEVESAPGAGSTFTVVLPSTLH
ncbi:CHASE2 domain-containing protein [uncultured Paludibaculum sp.]|uniref:CHASE2 domain-containing protein n=1 Tax=uncultured Paludibaculum sp. TaxID=1765020 RepID=UPI002AAB5417|nr:CHASE2 domain-containing protein [uncultured Paludibaculum sp.]